MSMPTERMPVVFAPHGGGPWPFVDIGFPKKEVDALAEYLRSLRALPKTPPKALLVVSAHWEAGVPTVMTNAHPPILYDYYGFPEESYRIMWPAPGDPALAARVQELLAAANIESASDDQRGFDHGTFIPFKLTYPEANVPAIQLSLQAGLDPEEHLAIGRIAGGRFSWAGAPGFGEGERIACEVQIRAHADPVPAFASQGSAPKPWPTATVMSAWYAGW